MRYLKISLSAFLASSFIGAAFAATPFSGPFIEAGYGSLKARTEDLILNTRTEPTTVGTGWHPRPGYYANVYGGGERQSSVGRVALGYGLMAPGNFNFTVNLATNTNRTLVDEWGNALKNTWNLTLQPGYFISPIRTLLYVSVGASLTDYVQVPINDFDPNGTLPPVDNHVRSPTDYAYGGGQKRNVVGLVWGAGVKLALTDRFYVAGEFSRTRYNNAKIQTSGTTPPNLITNINVGNQPAVTWQGYDGSGKIKLTTWLVNLGYRF